MRKIAPLRLAPPLLALLAACSAKPAYRDPDAAAPAVVAEVDLARYAGRWFEIARYPNSFQQGCSDSQALYAPRPEGGLRVVNSCLRDGARVEAEGVARIPDPASPAKLEVKFAPTWVPGGWGDYWVLHLEPDYSAALVGAPSGQYLWVLSRTPELESETRARIWAKAEALGYATAPLIEE